MNNDILAWRGRFEMSSAKRQRIYTYHEKHGVRLYFVSFGVLIHVS